MKIKHFVILIVFLAIAVQGTVLAQMSDELGIRSAMHKLDNGTIRERRNAAYYLGEEGDDAACMEALMARLDDPDPHIRRIAAHALGKIKAAKAAPELLDLAMDANQPRHVRCAAMCALVRMECSDALPVLKRMIHQEEGWVRNAAEKGYTRLLSQL